MTATKKNIVFCSTSFAEYDRRVQRIITALKEDDYKIFWISRRRHSAVLSDTLCSHQDIRCFFKSGIFFYIEFNIRLFIKLLRWRKNAVISAIDIDTLAAAWVMSKAFGNRLVFDAHEIFHEVPELEGRRFKKHIWKSLSAYVFPKLKYAYTVNNSLQDYFKREFDAEFEVIRNVPSLQIPVKLPTQQSRTLVYLGVVNKGRGVELALEAIQMMPAYRLKIVGEGDLSEDMKDLCAKLHISDRVDFKGYTEPGLVFNELSTCSIGLNMLDPSSGNYYYSLANKFFDYMHAGLPSISMNFPEYRGINEVYPSSVLLDTYSVEALISTVRELENTDLYLKMQSHALEAAQRFNWDRESKTLRKIYRRVFDPRVD